MNVTHRRFTGMTILLLGLLFLFAISSKAQSDQYLDEPDRHEGLFDIVPDSVEKGSLLVLGTTHLSKLGDQFDPELLDSLMGILEDYDPAFIGLEKMGPDLIAAMELWGRGHAQVLQMMAGRTMELGDSMQGQLDISWREASIRADSLLTMVKRGETDQREKLNWKQ